MPRTAPTPVTFEGTQFEGKTVEQVKNALYSKALQDLRNEHLEEFFDLVEGLYTANGLTYKRRLTDEQKAEQQVRTLLAAHPALAERITDVFPQGEVAVAE